MRRKIINFVQNLVYFRYYITEGVNGHFQSSFESNYYIIKSDPKSILSNAQGWKN